MEVQHKYFWQVHMGYQIIKLTKNESSAGFGHSHKSYSPAGAESGAESGATPIYPSWQADSLKTTQALRSRWLPKRNRRSRHPADPAAAASEVVSPGQGIVAAHAFGLHRKQEIVKCMNTKWTASTLKSFFPFLCRWPLSLFTAVSFLKREWIHSSVVRKYFKYFTCNKNTYTQRERKKKAKTETAVTDTQIQIQIHSWVREMALEQFALSAAGHCGLSGISVRRFFFSLFFPHFSHFPYSSHCHGLREIKPWIEALIELIEIGISVVDKKENGQLSHFALCKNQNRNKNVSWFFKINKSDTGIPC